MTTTTFRSALLIVTSLVLALAGVLAWQLLREARSTRAALAALTAQRTAADAAVAQARARLAVAENEAASHQTALAAPANAFVPTPATPAPRPQKMVNFSEELRRNPRLQALELAAKRAALVSTYGALYRRLGLTPAQISTFEDLTATRDETLQDLAAIADERGPRPDQATRTLMKQANDEYRSGVQALLGEQGVRQLDEYQRTAPIRDLVNGFAGAASLLGQPLTSAQGEQLTQIVARSALLPKGIVSPSRIDWSAVDGEAQAILSREQLALFRKADTSVGGKGSRPLWELNAVVNRAAQEELKKQGPRPSS